ncbi:sulfite exporter TauE/SafE family protein [Catenulispora subtropica]|uniref:Probable membrane transporter protein n=1 Tax=Catenulispora subtropica TaxID=450798 RepID=A0ABP5EKW0_9ACTN
MLFATIALGLLIGLALGALGGGGSILTVPALVYVLGEPVRTATTESLVIVGVAAVAGTVAHSRAGHVRWGPGVAFGLAGVAASYAGTAVNGRVDANLLLLAFAGLMAAAGVAMAVRRSGSPAQAPEVYPPRDADTANLRLHSAPARASAAVATVERTLSRASEATVAENGHPTARRPADGMVMILSAGVAVGFLTGFFGVGGGFVIVPALVMALRYRMPAAVGTSLLIIAVNSAAALSARIGHVTFHWSLLIPFALAALAGSLTGRRVADAVPAATLSRAFTVMLFAVAGYMALRSGLALTG